MKKLNDPERYRWIDYHHTDIARTFARVRRQQAEAKSAREAAERAEREAVEAAMRETERKVAPIKGRI